MISQDPLTDNPERKNANRLAFRVNWPWCNSQRREIFSSNGWVNVSLSRQPCPSHLGPSFSQRYMDLYSVPYQLIYTYIGLSIQYRSKMLKNSYKKDEMLHFVRNNLYILGIKLNYNCNIYVWEWKQIFDQLIWHSVGNITCEIHSLIISLCVCTHAFENLP